jgi:1-deoxy-D-xylulose-5-phosphate reductoisomerase
MRLPIAWALGWPDRVPGAAPSCDWTTAATWEFLPVDHEAFPALGLARRAGEAGGTAPAVFNAADEACVAAFLGGHLDFPGIPEVIAEVLQRHLGGDNQGAAGNPLTVQDVLDADEWARSAAAELIEGRGR